MSPIQVWLGLPKVISTETLVGAALIPVTAKLTLSGVPGVGPHPGESEMAPVPVPGNVVWPKAVKVDAKSKIVVVMAESHLLFIVKKFLLKENPNAFCQRG
jgi:hypothetical protein